MIESATRVVIQTACTTTGYLDREKWQAEQDRCANILVEKLSNGWRILHASVYASSIIAATEYILVKDTDDKKND